MTTGFQPVSLDAEVAVTYVQNREYDEKATMAIVEHLYAINKLWCIATELCAQFAHYQHNVYDQGNVGNNATMDYDLREEEIVSYILRYNQYYEHCATIDNHVTLMFREASGALKVKVPGWVHCIWVRNDDMGILFPISLARWPRDAEGLYLFGNLDLKKNEFYIHDRWFTL